MVKQSKSVQEDEVPKEVTNVLKVFGDDAVFRLGSNKSIKVDVIPSGSIALDVALGVGGIPRGRVTEIYGPESSGKTTLCQHIVGNAQKAGMIALYVDMENALEPDYAVKCGVDIDNLWISQPGNGEQALEIIDTFIHSAENSWCVIVDSVAALVPRAEIEGSMGDSHMGLQARLMSQAMRKIVASNALKNSNSLLVFTNQLRMKLGVQWGNPETTTGGNALKFYASVRLDVRRIQTEKTQGEATGNKVKVTVSKNKVAPPLRKAEFDIVYGEGISREGELLDFGDQYGIVTKKGAFYSLGDIRLGQGRDNARTFLKENPDLAQSIEVSIRESFKEKPMQVSEMEEEEQAEEL